MKKTKDQYKRVISFFSSVVLVLVLAFLFFLVWNFRYKDTIMFPYYRRGNYTLYAIYTLLIYLFFKVYGAFKIGYLKKTDMFYSQIIATTCVNTVAYFMICLIARHFMPVLPMAALTIADAFVILIWIFLSNKAYFLIYPPRRLVIVYGSEAAADLVYKMSLRIDKYIICESIRYDSNISEIKKQLLKYEGAIICDIPAKERRELLRYAYSHSLRVYLSPEITDIIMRGAEDVRLFDTPLLVCKNYGLTFEQKLFKRTFDVIVSVFLGILLSPAMLITAAAIKIYDGGPVLYKQKRLTIGEKEFYIYKFRSMIVGAEEEGAQLAKDGDKRITPIGRVIRACRLDELPQIFNILKGEMSFVGPRPERPEYYKEYSKTVPEFRYRLKVKAGLTGYAQVIGKYDTTPLDKLKMDMMYIENYSFVFDAQIILMTLKTVFFPPPNNSKDEIPLHDSNEENTKKKENELNIDHQD